MYFHVVNTSNISNYNTILFFIKKYLILQAYRLFYIDSAHSYICNDFG